MNDDMTKRKQELSGEYINEAIPHTLRDEPAWHYSVIDFEKGFDAGVAEMRAQVEKLRNEAISPKELTKLRRCSKGHVFVYGHPGKPFDHSPDCIFCLNTDKLTQERDALKAQVESLNNKVSVLSYRPPSELMKENEQLKMQSDSWKQNCLEQCEKVNELEVMLSDERANKQAIEQMNKFKDAKLATYKQTLDLAVNELTELKEFTASILEDMNHYYDNKCIPTLDEVNQCIIAYNQTEKTIEQIQKMRGG